MPHEILALDSDEFAYLVAYLNVTGEEQEEQRKQSKKGSKTASGREPLPGRKGAKTNNTQNVTL